MINEIKFSSSTQRAPTGNYDNRAIAHPPRYTAMGHPIQSQELLAHSGTLHAPCVFRFFLESFLIHASRIEVKKKQDTRWFTRSSIKWEQIINYTPPRPVKENGWDLPHSPRWARNWPLWRPFFDCSRSGALTTMTTRKSPQLPSLTRSAARWFFHTRDCEFKGAICIACFFVLFCLAPIFCLLCSSTFVRACVCVWAANRSCRKIYVQHKLHHILLARSVCE